MGTPTEPAKYFQEGHWFSVKKGDWVDPTSEIRMDVMGPRKDKSDEELLDQTEQFIEKIDAVERYRKESETAPIVNIVIHPVEDEPLEEDESEENVAEVVESSASVNNVVAEEDGKVDIVDAEPYDYVLKDDNCEMEDEDKIDVESYYRENGYDTQTKSEPAEDTQSIMSVYTGVEGISKTVFQAGEEVNDDLGFNSVEEPYFRGSYKVMEGGVVVDERVDEDVVSLKEVNSKAGSLRSIQSINHEKNKTGSVKSIKSVRSEKVINESVKSVKNTRSGRPSILENNIFNVKDDDMKENDQVEGDLASVKGMNSRSGSVRSVQSVQSKKNETGSVKSIKSVHSKKSLNGSIKSVKSNNSGRPSILEESVFKTGNIENEGDNISVKTLTEEDIDSSKEKIKRVGSVRSVKSGLSEKDLTPEESIFKIQDVEIEGNGILSSAQEEDGVVPSMDVNSRSGSVRSGKSVQSEKNGTGSVKSIKSIRSEKSSSGSIKSVKVSIEDDHASLKGINSRSGSIRSVQSVQSEKNGTGSVKSIKSIRSGRVSILEDSIFKAPEN